VTGLGKLILAKFVEYMELKRKRSIGSITLGSQLDRNDNSSIRDHHTHVSEQYLKVLWELLSTSVTGVHGNEITTSHDKLDLAAWWFTREWEVRQVSFFGVGDGSNLSGDHRQSGERNSVELIEATPKSRLADTFEDLGHILEFMLIGTVGDNDINTECAT
jgi:hypothetical protein